MRATLALKLYGEDLATLDRLTARMKAVLSTVPGVADLSAGGNKLTIGLIFMLLYTAFNWVRHASLIIPNVPFANTKICGRVHCCLPYRAQLRHPARRRIFK